jgi:hypothetical protein
MQWKYKVGNKTRNLKTVLLLSALFALDSCVEPMTKEQLIQLETKQLRENFYTHELFIPSEQVMCTLPANDAPYQTTADNCIVQLALSPLAGSMQTVDKAEQERRVRAAWSAEDPQKAEEFRQADAAAQQRLATQLAEQQQRAQQEATARVLRARKVDRVNRAAARMLHFAATSGIATVVPIGVPPTSADKSPSSSGGSTCAPDSENSLQRAMMGASYKGGCSEGTEAASSSSGGSIQVTVEQAWLTDDGGVNLVHVLNTSSRPIKLLIWTADCVNLEVANCGYMPSPSRPLPPHQETQFTVGRDDDAQAWGYTVQCSADGTRACGTSGGGGQNPCISNGSCAGRNNPTPDNASD